VANEHRPCCRYRLGAVASPSHLLSRLSLDRHREHSIARISRAPLASMHRVHRAVGGGVEASGRCRSPCATRYVSEGRVAESHLRERPQYDWHLEKGNTEKRNSAAVCGTQGCCASHPVPPGRCFIFPRRKTSWLPRTASVYAPGYRAGIRLSGQRRSDFSTLRMGPRRYS
jgi:hypothetical protein